ncbi:uncharacterized protein LOC126843174 [Adelges cooleyi]|uniref:uncharacterized protein LOC126843174 n=1 Tax=Adelges cooleyi TaxID=133065 RepID=UPI00218084FC|nr:uncharacterized protein LOC126843174 [Adelges cooleyi]
MKMFYVSLCSIFFAIVHVQSWKYGEIRSANDINREFIRKIVNVEEVENWAPIIKQTIIYNDIYKPALSLISKEDQLTKTINVLDLLQTYVKGEETKETVDINVIRDLITVCYECTCLKSLSLFALLVSEDLKKLKKYHETIKKDETINDKKVDEKQDVLKDETNHEKKVDEKQDVLKDESTTHTCMDKHSQGAGWTSPYDPYNCNTDEKLLKNYRSPLYKYQLRSVMDRFEIRGNDNEKCSPGVPPQVIFSHNILQMENTFIAMIRKLAALDMKYNLPLEIFRVIYGQRADDVTDDNYINGVLSVLEETIKIADDLLTKKCVDHQGSLVKKYDVFLDDGEGKEIKQFITALDQDSNMEYNSRLFENFVVFAEKAIKETNSVALSDKLEVPTDLALLDKCSSMKVTIDQGDLELVLNNPFFELSSQNKYLEGRSPLYNYKLLDSTFEDNNWKSKNSTSDYSDYEFRIQSVGDDVEFDKRFANDFSDGIEDEENDSKDEEDETKKNIMTFSKNLKNINMRVKHSTV